MHWLFFSLIQSIDKRQRVTFHHHGTQGGYIGHYFMHLRINVKPHHLGFRKGFELYNVPHGQGGEFELG